ncbi:GTPase [Flavobacterium soyangense]|uniref:50S ribosome-binding GTPase n=1 Tax=Flavobacterium soyangense TaxID=2023265 RepID=A0A930U863_9FLAO|nr:GTPase [Flavobacterium soyangense]MBF2708698.1 50S ribosome-binding GTPase [Flavobacterium soyangense]
MDTQFAETHINEFIEKLRNDYEARQNAVVKIAISGQSGSGKSSLINAILGRKVAEVGITETTTHIKSYISGGIHFSDLPGCGTVKFPVNSYIDNCKLNDFDAVIIVTANRFYENDIWLIEEMVSIGRPVYVVRTKMDTSIKDGEHDEELNETEVFEKVKEDIKKNVGNIKINGVYLISSRVPLKMDLPNLLVDIKSNLDSIKRQRFISDVSPLNSQILLAKREVAISVVKYRAAAAALNGINPIPGLDISLDIAILLNMASEIKKIYGLDEENISELSKKMKSKANFTAFSLKVGQYSSKFITKEGIIIILKRFAVSLSSQEMLKYIPIIGQIASAGIGYKMTYSFGDNLIMESESLVNEILVRTEEDIVS